MFLKLCLVVFLLSVTYARPYLTEEQQEVRGQLLFRSCKQREYYVVG